LELTLSCGLELEVGGNLRVRVRVRPVGLVRVRVKAVVQGHWYDRVVSRLI
jgi:hypothetical protein